MPIPLASRGGLSPRIDLACILHMASISVDAVVSALDGTRLEQVVHQGCIELGLHVQQAGLFVGITTGPVGVGLGYSPVQKTQGINFHRDGGDYLVVFHRY